MAERVIFAIARGRAAAIVEGDCTLYAVLPREPGAQQRSVIASAMRKAGVAGAH